MMEAEVGEGKIWRICTADRRWSQGMWSASTSWKRQGNRFFPGAPRKNAALPMLDFKISDLQICKIKNSCLALTGVPQLGISFHKVKRQSVSSQST